ncbi:hypothetical protein A2U01_0079222, partial [Trifolium medium]|nr:hypothetical protein [Trifolium medium]
FLLLEVLLVLRLEVTELVVMAEPDGGLSCLDIEASFGFMSFLFLFSVMGGLAGRLLGSTRGSIPSALHLLK